MKASHLHHKKKTQLAFIPYHVGVTAKNQLVVIAPRYRVNKNTCIGIIIVQLLPSCRPASPVVFNHLFLPSIESHPSCLINIILSFQKQDDKKLGCHWRDSCCDCSWSIRPVGPDYREEEEKER